ncbi:legumain [Galendromus occidentalis]|uniref:legumain n=1 Tax=Galendromus occidentalis TaxID=34638 RepID=A0AAJ6QWU5_9ACAR|nr:legumain [Galendromus occidentalis]
MLSSSLPFVAAVVLSIAGLCSSADSEPRIWALLVAGSNGYYNYRHQADVCHAYQILHRNGVPDERIVVMMFDDIANSSDNPTKGVIINHPDGSDVYRGVPKDYTGNDVSPQNFLSILKGDTTALRGIGSGKVIESTPEDHIFVYFADHGAQGLVAFPNDYLYSTDLVKTLVDMHSNKRYAKLVFYMEACESGSMFSGLLPEDINVFATTASSPDESSYACYFDDLRQTYLGDVYSVKWMEDSDIENLSQETLQKQYSIVKAETTTSAVHEYGNLTMGSSFPVSQFQGTKGATAEKLPRAHLDATNARDVPVAILRRRIRNSFDEDTRSILQKDLNQLLRNRIFLRNKVTQIAKSLGAAEALQRKLTLKDHTCYRQAVERFHNICFNLPSNPYSLGFLRTFTNLCESGVKIGDILSAMDSVCIHPKIVGIV